MNQSDPNSSGGSSHEECDNIHWRGVWSLSIPPKVKHFVWRALKNSLPTRANLLRRGVAVDSTCGQCDAATESLDHCLLECTRARSFWFGSSLGLRWSNDCQVSFKEWFTGWMNKEDLDTVNISSMVAWCIWKSRNSLYFDGKVVDPRVALQSATDFLLQLKATKHATPRFGASERICRWCPPPPNFLKLNSDASVVDSDTWGIATCSAP